MLLPLAIVVTVVVVVSLVNEYRSKKEKESGIYMSRAAVLTNEKVRQRQLFRRKLPEELKRHKLHNAQMYEVGSGGYNNPFQQ